MTTKFETFNENTVISITQEKIIPFVNSKMFDPLDFAERLKKSSGNGIYQWIANSFECNVLAPNQNWRQGKITLELLFYPEEIALIGNDTIISLTECNANGDVKEVSFFSPDTFVSTVRNTQGQEAYKLINNKSKCRVLMPTKEWQSGEIGLFLVFYPDLNILDEPPELVDSSLDGIRKIIAEVSPLDEIRNSLVESN